MVLLRLVQNPSNPVGTPASQNQLQYRRFSVLAVMCREGYTSWLHYSASRRTLPSVDYPEIPTALVPRQGTILA